MSIGYVLTLPLHLNTILSLSVMHIFPLALLWQPELVVVKLCSHSVRRTAPLDNASN